MSYFSPSQGLGGSHRGASAVPSLGAAGSNPSIAGRKSPGREEAKTDQARRASCPPQLHGPREPGSRGDCSLVQPLWKSHVWSPPHHCPFCRCDDGSDTCNTSSWSNKHSKVTVSCWVCVGSPGTAVMVDVPQAGLWVAPHGPGGPHSSSGGCHSLDTR